MASTEKRRPLTQEEQQRLDESIKRFLGDLTNQLVKKNIDEAADVIGKSKSTIHAMKREGAGLATSYIKLFMHYLELNEEDLSYFIEHIGDIMDARRRKSSMSQQLFREVRNHTDENELVGWLKLLLAKVQIEAEMGTRPEPQPVIKVLKR